MYANLFSCMGAAIGSKGHYLVFSALKMVIKGKTYVHSSFFLIKIT